MTKLQRNSKRSKQARTNNVGPRLRTTILNAGCPRLFVIATLFAAALASLVYYQFISAQTVANNALNQTLIEKRKQNAIARMVQETKPEFLDQFRRLVNNYSTARELLPGETEVSNVLDAIQQMARTNHVRVTMFDASKPGAKFNNPAATATTNPGPTPASKSPQSPQTSRPDITLNERVMPAQIQGTHANVARFLSDVAKYPRIIYVRDLSITSLNSQESVNLTLVTYDAPTSGILPPIPTELRAEFQTHAGQLPN
jgi:Tfp pilus assembly protein PilO